MKWEIKKKRFKILFLTSSLELTQFVQVVILVSDFRLLSITVSQTMWFVFTSLAE